MADQLDNRRAVVACIRRRHVARHGDPTAIDARRIQDPQVALDLDVTIDFEVPSIDDDILERSI